MYRRMTPRPRRKPTRVTPLNNPRAWRMLTATRIGKRWRVKSWNAVLSAPKTAAALEGFSCVFGLEVLVGGQESAGRPVMGGGCRVPLCSSISASWYCPRIRLPLRRCPGRNIVLLCTFVRWLASVFLRQTASCRSGAGAACVVSARFRTHWLGVCMPFFVGVL